MTETDCISTLLVWQRGIVLIMTFISCPTAVCWQDTCQGLLQGTCRLQHLLRANANSSMRCFCAGVEGSRPCLAKAGTVLSTLMVEISPLSQMHPYKGTMQSETLLVTICKPPVHQKTQQSYTARQLQLGCMSGQVGEPTAHPVQKIRGCIVAPAKSACQVSSHAEYAHLHQQTSLFKAVSCHRVLSQDHQITNC